MKPGATGGTSPDEGNWSRGAGHGSLQRLEPLTLWRPPRHGEWPWLETLVTTRSGGVSQPPYAALNLGGSTGDLPTSVQANRDLLRRTLALDGEAWHPLRQVHGTRVVEAGTEAEPQADGQWTKRTGSVLVVGIADCVPVFLWDARLRRVALVHAGWRGTAAGVVVCAVECLQRAGSNASDLWMAMGPSIGPCCYEVGPEVAARFPVDALRGAVRLDLRAANRLQAHGCGIAETQILADPPCTACQSELYYSHRKLGPRTGRLWALAWLTGAADRPEG